MESSVDTGFVCKGLACVRLTAGRYSAVVSPLTGSSVLRMTDEENDIEVFRYSEDCSLEEYNSAREIWGLPTLYLPNRFDGGLLRTSDAEYHLPVNETDLGNHLHGWVQKREHRIEASGSSEGRAFVTTSYTFDEKDEMFECFPLRFKLSYTFELSEEKGLVQTIKLENLSDKQLPVSLCTHTCISAPIVRGGSQEGIRLTVPIEKKCELNERCLPTEKLLPLGERDLCYKQGTMKAVLQDIDNDMYTAAMGELDGKPFYGVTVTDLNTGKRICNEVSKEFRFWNMWNDKGFNGYFCPEPMTAMINAPNLSLGREVTGYSELAPGESYQCSQRFFTPGVN